MKTIIAGSRTITDIELVRSAVVESGFLITEVVSGAAMGVDTLGEHWALAAGIPLRTFPAQWNVYGKRAGFLRNIDMANYADALIAVTSGSPGTRHMIETATQKGLQVYVKGVR